ncbi:MAG: alpha/beta hydrolase [Candidatus Woesearchaeota archaeon]|nr:alpha/beta hydrolase [Candidatus Woesearchaeota archaeon]
MRGIAWCILFLLLLTPVSALYKEGKDTRGTYKVTDLKHSPVIFLPGVAGSELWWGKKNAWPGWVGQRVTGGNFDKLALDKKGKGEKIHATKSIQYGVDTSLLQAMGIYGDFFIYMANEGYGLEENLTSGKRLYDFAYDWRFDNEKTVKDLEKFVKNVKKETKSDKVILFAHSMGGVVTRLYLKDPKNAENVAGVVFMGTPHQGSPKPFYAFAQGYNFGNKKLSNEKMWEIMPNWEAGYQLIQAEFEAFDQDGNDISMDFLFGEDWISHMEYKAVLKNPKHKVRYGLPNREYTGKIVNFQKNILGDTLTPYDHFEYHMIEGTGQETTYGFALNIEDKPEVDKPVVFLIELTNTEGDGTVPASGAKVNGLDGHYTVNRDHGGIPSDPKSHPTLTQLRKKFNNPNNRTHTAWRIKGYAGAELTKMAFWPDSGSVFAALKNKFVDTIIRPDAEKIEAREELRGIAKEMTEEARVNIFVADGTEKEDTFYLVINDQKILDSGTGKIHPNTAKVYVDSFETLDAVLSGRMTMKEAMYKEKVIVKGTKIVNRFKLKIFTWWNYWAQRSNDTSIK